MNITKSITKYIPFALKALVSIIVIMTLPPIIIGAIKYFQPKEIFIDDIKVVAPKGTRLYTASVDDKDMQKPYSPILLQNTYQYTYPERSYAMFWFHAISSKANTRALHIYINVDSHAKNKQESENNFRKYIQHKRKEKKYSKFIEIESKKCFGYYEETKKGINSGINSVDVFHRKKNVTISILSKNSNEIQKVLHQFCADLSIEKLY